MIKDYKTIPPRRKTLRQAESKLNKQNEELIPTITSVIRGGGVIISKL